MLILKTAEQQCSEGSNPSPSAATSVALQGITPEVACPRVGHLDPLGPHLDHRPAKGGDLGHPGPSQVDALRPLRFTWVPVQPGKAIPRVTAPESTPHLPCGASRRTTRAQGNRTATAPPEAVGSGPASGM